MSKALQWTRFVLCILAVLVDLWLVTDFIVVMLSGG